MISKVKTSDAKLFLIKLQEAVEQESAGKYLCFRESPKGDAWYEYGRSYKDI